MSGKALVALATAASALLVVIYLAAGGGEYETTPVADPCAPREWRAPEGVEEAAQQFFLSALDGAACELGVSREALVAGLATEESRAEFAADQAIEEAELEAAVRAGLVRAIDDAVAADALDPLVADGLRAAATRLPVDQAIALIDGTGTIFDGAGGVIGGVLGQAGGLLP